MLHKYLLWLQKSTILRYIAVGGISYVAEMTILFSLINILRLGNVVAISIGFWSGLIISFLLQKILTFKNNELSPKRLRNQTIYYGALVLVNYGFTIALTTVLSPIMGIAVSRTIALVITTIWNFIIYKKIIFKNNEPDA